MEWYKTASDVSPLTEGDIIDFELTAADLGLWLMLTIGMTDGIVSERRVQRVAASLKHRGWRQSLERLAKVGLILPRED